MLPLIAVTALLLRRKPGQTKQQLAGLFVAAAVLIVALSISKATALPVYGAGIAAAWIYLTIRARRLNLRALVLGVLVGLSYAGNFFVVLRGASHGTEVKPGGTFRSMLNGMLTGIDPSVQPGPSVLDHRHGRDRHRLVDTRRRRTVDSSATPPRSDGGAAAGRADQCDHAAGLLYRLQPGTGLLRPKRLCLWGSDRYLGSVLHRPTPVLRCRARAGSRRRRDLLRPVPDRRADQGLPRYQLPRSDLRRSHLSSLCSWWQSESSCSGLVMRGSRRTWAVIAVAALLGTTVSPTVVSLARFAFPPQAAVRVDRARRDRGGTVHPPAVRAGRPDRDQHPLPRADRGPSVIRDPSGFRATPSAAYSSRAGRTRPGRTTSTPARRRCTGPSGTRRSCGINDEAFTAPTVEGLETLRTKYGVQWLLADERVAQSAGRPGPPGRAPLPGRHCPRLPALPASAARGTDRGALSSPQADGRDRHALVPGAVQGGDGVQVVVALDRRGVREGLLTAGRAASVASQVARVVVGAPVASRQVAPIDRVRRGVG